MFPRGGGIHVLPILKHSGTRKKREKRQEQEEARLLQSCLRYGTSLGPQASERKAMPGKGAGQNPPETKKKIQERASARSLARALVFPGSTTGRSTNGMTRVRVTRDGRRIVPVPGPKSSSGLILQIIIIKIQALVFSFMVVNC